MNDQSRRAEPSDPQIAAALREYLERVDRGKPGDREEFLVRARHALIANQLRSFIAAEDELRKLAGAKRKVAGWITWSVLAFGLVVFGLMAGVIAIHLNRTAMVIDIADPGVEVAVKGTTLTIAGPDKQVVKVVPGGQELTITYAGRETVTKRFAILKGQTKVVTVSIVNSQIVPRLENEIVPLTPAREEKTSSPTRVIRTP